MAANGSEKLRLKALNIEKGSSRFPRRDGVDPPELAAWRNNLAAFSQRRNLLFTAQNRKIYVWKPTGPWQTLGRTPALILTPVMKNPNAKGYLSRIVMRHAINHIIVDELGQDEVLLLATDSGNVCGYRVDSFHRSIERAKAAGETLPVQEPHIEPFLCEHVGASAWGLAVHKLARLVAVSSNTCNINVFAFALTRSPDQDGKSDNAAWERFTDLHYTQEWVTIETLDDLRYFRKCGMLDRRSHNLRLVYQGHRHNIPSVSFFNYDLVSDGAWMVSVDIENRVIFWNIWKSLNPWTEVDLRMLARNDPRFSADERGWSVVALDPRSFRFRRTFAEAINSHNYKKFADMGEFPAMRDVTDPNDTLPDFTRGYPFVPPVEKPNPDEVLDEFFFPDIFGEEKHSIDIPKKPDSPRGTKRNLSEEDSEESEPEMGEQQSRERPSAPEAPDTSMTSHEPLSNASRRRSSSDDGSEQHGEPRSPETSTAPGAADPDELMDSFRRRILNIVQGNQGHSDSNDNIGFLMETLGELLALPEPESEGESSDESDDFISVHSVHSVEIEDEQEHELEALKMDGRILPVLQFSEEHVRMIPGPMAGRPTVISGSHRQMFLFGTDEIRQLEDFQRFNMVKYIPEDGLVVAASQMGRVAIMSLGEAHLKGPTFRFHWVVPFKSQEKYGDRPMVPLVGMAVSPVQGQGRPVELSNCPRARHDRLIDSEGRSIEVSDDGSNPDFDLSSTEKNTSNNRYLRPRERWQGWQSSRRYRLLLIYGDHTVMSYEFWYEQVDCDDMIL